MIVVRNFFRIKFGKTKEATALWKQCIAITRRIGFTGEARLLTDVAGLPYYTVVLELSFPSLAELEKHAQAVMGNSEWRECYEKLVPLTETGHREILKVID